MKKLFAALLLLGLVAGTAQAAGPADSSDSFLNRVAKALRLKAPDSPDTGAGPTTSPRSTTPPKANEVLGGPCTCSGGGLGTLSIGGGGGFVCTCCNPDPRPDREPIQY